MQIDIANEKYNVPKIAQYANIKHSKHLCCACGYADYSRKYSYEIVGFVDTPQGYMIVCECPKCFDKYRHHIGTTGRYNLESFKKELWLKLHLINKRK